MRQDEAITRAYLNALGGIGAPVFTSIPSDAPQIYAFLSVSSSPETTTKTEFEYLFEVIIEVHSIGDAYNATKLQAVKLMEEVFEALQPIPNNTIAVDGYQMVRQSLTSTRNDETLFTSNKIIRKIAIFDAVITK